MSSTPPTSSRPHLVSLLERRLGVVAERADKIAPGEQCLRIDRRDLPQVLVFLRTDPDAQLDLLVDLTILDQADTAGEVPPEARYRFDLFVRLRSSRLRYRLSLRVGLPDDDPAFPSLFGAYPVAAAFEREIFDLFGVFPDGHPHLRRTTLYEAFAGHPLRRDYPGHKSQPLVALKRLGPAATVIEDTTTIEGPEDAR